MKLGGLQKCTLSDYPGKIAAMLFTVGCNFKCVYCHNKQLIDDASVDGSDVDETEVLDFLVSRKQQLNGLVVSGGEPTLQIGLKSFLKRIKEKTGLAIKLDTNGSRPTVLKKLIDDGLVDYVALDIKSSEKQYAAVAGVSVNTELIWESVNILEASQIPHEYRTTAFSPFVCAEDLFEIAEKLVGHYYLQPYILTENVTLGALSSTSLQKLSQRLCTPELSCLVRD